MIHLFGDMWSRKSWADRGHNRLIAEGRLILPVGSADWQRAVAVAGDQNKTRRRK